MIDRMNNEFHISVLREGCHGQESGFGQQRDSSGPHWSCSQLIFILPALLPKSTLRYQLVILLGRIVSARRVMCLHVNILLVYRLLGLDIASLIHTYRTNRC
jgi:hypothetical protein